MINLRTNSTLDGDNPEVTTQVPNVILLVPPGNHSIRSRIISEKTTDLARSC